MKIKSQRIWVGGSFIPGVIEMEADKILRVLPYDEAPADMDYGRNRILPGFIDIHTHGAYGFDTTGGDPEGLKNWKQRLPSEGVTSFLATTVTASKDAIKSGLENVVKVKAENTPGADILGVHLEGPYIDAEFHGAQPLEAVVKPTVEEFDEYQAIANGLIRVVTLAPEHDQDFALTRHCAQNGVAVSLGHSSAALEQAALAIANGARSVTHTYNGMSSFSHRANGMVGAALRFDSLYTEIICDCNHCTPEALNLLFRAKGKEKPIMISDSVKCKGYPVGETCSFSGLDVVIYPDGSAHLASDGTFAGSTLRLNDGLRNLVERAMVPFDAAVNACTVNPATLLGVNDHIGSIVSGYDADLVVLDKDYNVLDTYCKGARQIL